MNTQVFDKAVALAERRQHMLVSTVDQTGMPHIASIGSVRFVSEQKLALADWYCPATTVNVQKNTQLSMVVWDIATDTGYQLLGEVEAVQPPEDPTGDPLEKELIVRIDTVLNFSHAYHTDVEIDDSPESVLSSARRRGAGNGELRSSGEWENSYLFLKQNAADV